MYSEAEVSRMVRDAWQEGARRQRVANALQMQAALERLEGTVRYVDGHDNSWDRLKRMVSANVANLRLSYQTITSDIRPLN
jgi:hypothetical protein